MPIQLTRRRLLQALAAVSATPLLSIADALAAGVPHGKPHPFSFEMLRQRALRLAQQHYHPQPPRHPKLLEQIDYDTYQKIHFDHAHALWADANVATPAEFFHLGRYAKQPVAIYALDDGQARRIHYSKTLFDYGDTGLGEMLPDDLGFAGFRLMDPGDHKRDWLAFQGASYFRSAGPLNQYGLSARGLAVNTAVAGVDEEFPRFTAFWLRRPAPDTDAMTIYALLEGPSITGAYRFDCRKHDAVVMDVHAELFQRQAIERLGIAPLTSMYWYSETNHRQGPDWRPEVHDSDGLALWTGNGERLWRPLNNPPHLQINSFMDHDPKGFGLLQRDRDFDHYQDDGVWYNRRPSVWVEPRGDWGAGAVQLLEMPTDDEIYDNITAFWVPDRQATADVQWTFDYRLHWVAEEPYPPSLARVIATRRGRPGTAGQHTPRDPNARKFVIDFHGGPLANMHQRYDLTVNVHAARGRVDNRHVLKVVGTDYWRAFFDLHVDGADPVNLRCYLSLDDRTLTETWIYQYFPQAESRS